LRARLACQQWPREAAHGPCVQARNYAQMTGAAILKPRILAASKEA